MRKLMGERTTLIVAHRLSTIRSADRILLVQNVRVQEIRSFSEIATEMGKAG